MEGKTEVTKIKVKFRFPTFTVIYTRNPYT